MDETTSFRSYGEEVIRERLSKMLSYVRAVRRGDDIEALHDMRVASRRLRAALSIFGASFPAREFAAFEREVKAVTDALGEARDLDVMIDTLEKLEETLPRAQRGGVESFAERQRETRRKRQHDIVDAFERLEHHNLERWFDALVEAAEAQSGARRAAAQTEPAQCADGDGGDA